MLVLLLKKAKCLGASIQFFKRQWYLPLYFSSHPSLFLCVYRARKGLSLACFSMTVLFENPGPRQPINAWEAENEVAEILFRH
jgi:hypothetical protein